MKHYKIYQLKSIAETRYAFRSWEEAEKYFSMDDYKLVYEGSIKSDSDINILNKLWDVFNLDHPHDFRGHSMSMSDVVQINGKRYYCDSRGWKELK